MASHIAHDTILQVLVTEGDVMPELTAIEGTLNNMVKTAETVHAASKEAEEHHFAVGSMVLHGAHGVPGCTAFLFEKATTFCACHIAKYAISLTCKHD